MHAYALIKFDGPHPRTYVQWASTITREDHWTATVYIGEGLPGGTFAFQAVLLADEITGYNDGDAVDWDALGIEPLTSSAEIHARMRDPADEA